MLLEIESTVDCKVVSMVDSFVGVQAMQPILNNIRSVFLITNSFPTLKEQCLIYVLTLDMDNYGEHLYQTYHIS